jgi:uncharacterized protein with HEPN domain
MLSRRDRLAARDMLRAARRALTYAAVEEVEFATDEMRQDAAMHALTVLGEASKRLSPEGRAAFAGLD